MNDRDRKLRTARRLGAGVIALGVTGSIGLAGLIGLSSAKHPAASATTSTKTSGTRAAPGSGSGGTTTQGGDDQNGDDNGGGFVFPNTNQQQAPSIGQGNGSAPHASTSGS